MSLCVVITQYLNISSYPLHFLSDEEVCMKVLPIILVGLLCSTSQAAEPEMLKKPLVVPITPEKVATYRELIQEYSAALKQELTTAIKEGGAIEALHVCNVKAPEIANQVSEKAGINVSRTSLKPRNAASAPDTWEEAVLKSFETRKAKGEDPSKLEFHAVVENNGKREMRYMKAIPTAELCLNCHGSQLQPDIQDKISTLYPQDKAVGFKVGDLRGAFIVREALSE